MSMVALGEIAEIQLGKMLSPKAKSGEGTLFPYLRNQNVQWGRFELADLALMEFSEREREKFHLRAGDLLVCEGGEPGRCAIWTNQVDCYYQKALHRVRPYPNKADPEFLSLWIRHQAFVGAFEDQNAKTTIAHLPLVRLEQLLIPDVPFAEQRRIAARLRTQLAAVEQARQAAQAQAAETEALQAAIYRDAFAGIVPVAVPPIHAQAPTSWRWAKLNEIALLESGHTPSRARPDWWDGDVSWVSLTAIRALDGGWVQETQIKTNEQGIAHSAARILPRGTVCFSRTASVGFVTIMAKPMATSQDFANWVCGDDLDPEFLMYALICSRTELRALATGATHKTIYMPTLEAFHLCLPDKAEQLRIVARLKTQLAAVAQARKAAQAQLVDIEALPARLLARAFDADHFADTSKMVTRDADHCEDSLNMVGGDGDDHSEDVLDMVREGGQ